MNEFSQYKRYGGALVFRAAGKLSLNRFSYQRAADVDDALRMGSDPQSAFLGGGTGLLDLMKLAVERPKLLIDLNHAGMGSIIVDSGGGLRIGALATMAQAAAHTDVRSRFKLLHQALLAGATPQLRNAATMGGNLLQRPRCFYFREKGFRCNKRKSGSGCDAIHGINESHAIFDAGPSCIAVHPSDLATALMTLDAEVELRNGSRERRVALPNFFSRPEQDPTRETVIEPGELMIAIHIPSGSRGLHAAYVKVPPAGGFAIVSAAVALELSAGKVASARITLGGVAHGPWRAHFGEARVVGRQAREETWREAAAAELSRACGSGHNDLKIALAREVLSAALAQAAGMGE